LLGRRARFRAYHAHLFRGDFHRCNHCYVEGLAILALVTAGIDYAKQGAFVKLSSWSIRTIPRVVGGGKMVVVAVGVNGVADRIEARVYADNGNSDGQNHAIGEIHWIHGGTTV